MRFAPAISRSAREHASRSTMPLRSIARSRRPATMCRGYWKRSSANGERWRRSSLPPPIRARSGTNGWPTRWRAAKPAILCEERRFTYREICTLADRAGAGLMRMGLAPGGGVLMLLDDGPEYVAAIFGAPRGGFVPVLVNTLSPADLVAYLLQD